MNLIAIHQIVRSSNSRDRERIMPGEPFVATKDEGENYKRQGAARPPKPGEDVDFVDTGGEDTGGEDTGGEDTGGEDTGGEDTPTLQERMIEAIGTLPSDDDHWTQAGKPEVQALSEALGETVTAAQRDEAFEAYQAQQDSEDEEI